MPIASGGQSPDFTQRSTNPAAKSNSAVSESSSSTRGGVGQREGGGEVIEQPLTQPHCLPAWLQFAHRGQISWVTCDHPGENQLRPGGVEMAGDRRWPARPLPTYLPDGKWAVNPRQTGQRQGTHGFSTASSEASDITFDGGLSPHSHWP